MDLLSTAERSRLMARIRSNGTTPERNLRAMMSDLLGPKYPVESNVMDLPGAPDILVRDIKLVIFADGCFFHGCPKHGHTPKSKRDYWRPKLARNAARDRRNRLKLRRLGYSVWRFWEHDLRADRLERSFKILERRILKRVLSLGKS